MEFGFKGKVSFSLRILPQGRDSGHEGDMETLPKKHSGEKNDPYVGIGGSIMMAVAPEIISDTLKLLAFLLGAAFVAYGFRRYLFRLCDYLIRRKKRMFLVSLGALLIAAGGVMVWRGLHPSLPEADAPKEIVELQNQQSEEPIISLRQVDGIRSTSNWLKIDITANAGKPLYDCKVIAKKIYRIDDDGKDAKPVQVTEAEFEWEDSGAETVRTVPAGHTMSVDVMRIYKDKPADFMPHLRKTNVEAELRRPGTYRFYFTVIANDEVVAKRRVKYRRNDNGSALWELEDVAR